MEPTVNSILESNFGITSTGAVHALSCRNLCGYAVPTERDLRLGARPAKCCIKVGTDAARAWDSMGTL
jgi:hypothetical protein